MRASGTLICHYKESIALVSEVLSRSEQSPGGFSEVLDEVRGSALVRKWGVEGRGSCCSKEGPR